MGSQIEYTRNIESFALVCEETKILAGTIGGRLLTIDVETFEIENEIDAHTGTIIAMDVHGKRPLVCTLSVDQHASVWEISDSGIPSRLFEANLRGLAPENEHHAPPSTSVSQAIAFHPEENALLVRAADGSVAEIVFDGEAYRFAWCRAFFPDSETAYVRYVDDGASVLVSAGGGRMSVFDRHDRAAVKFTYRYNHEVLHAAEQIAGDDYLLPSDSRRVIRVNLKDNGKVVVGPPIVRDHLERVDYNTISGRAFASSFDRQIHEVAPDTCESLGVVLQTPMKCRWIQSLRRDPDTLIVQCRNGALYKVGLGEGKVLGVIKQTPNALWSGVARDDGTIIIAGEGSELLELLPGGHDALRGQNGLVARWTEISCDPGCYTKRLALVPLSGDLLLARTDGKVLRWDRRRLETVLDYGSPLRDIAVDPSGGHFWVAAEDATIVRCSLQGQVRAKFESPRDEPVWALAHNPIRGIVAVAEREGLLSLLDADSLSVDQELTGFRRTKRMRWVGDHRLWAVSLSTIREIDLRLETVCEVIPNQRNTIEDFQWSEDRRYLALVTYAQDITLYDFGSLTHMHTISFDMHYPKGLLWQKSAPGRYEFLVWGRSGVARHYRVHDGRIVPLGPISETLSRVHPGAGIEVYPTPARTRAAEAGL